MCEKFWFWGINIFTETNQNTDIPHTHTPPKHEKLEIW